MVNPLEVSFVFALPNTQTLDIHATWMRESHFENDLNGSLLFMQESCLSVHKSIQGPLGHYAVHVTSAARPCSQSLCNNNGRCVRKTPGSSSYLRVPQSSRRKYVHNRSFRFTISPSDKLKTIRNMKNGFACHCYYGWQGQSCQQGSSEHLRGNNKASMTNFSAFRSVTLSVILLHFFYPRYNPMWLFPWNTWVEDVDIFL